MARGRGRESGNRDALARRLFWGGGSRLGRFERQLNREDGTAPFSVTGANLAAVIGDDSLANGEAQAGTLFFSIGGEGLKELGSDLVGNAVALILDFGDKVIFHLFKSKDLLSAIQHFIYCVVHKIG